MGEDGIRKVILVELAGQLASLAPCAPGSPKMRDNIKNEPSHKLSKRTKSKNRRFSIKELCISKGSSATAAVGTALHISHLLWHSKQGPLSF